MTVEKTLGELAAAVGGTVRGDPATRIARVAPIDTAGPGDLTFVANEHYARKARTTRASAIVVAPGFADVGKPLIEVANPYAAWARLVKVVAPRREHPGPGVSAAAHVDATARLGVNVAIAAGAFVDAQAALGDRTIVYPQVFIGRNVTIGDDCVFYPGVRIYDGTRIGSRVTIQSNSVIGSDGFGFAPEGRHYVPVPQVGTTVIGDDVDIGSNVTVNRGALGETRIGRGTKIDSGVVVAHNVLVGEDTILVAQVGISGSVRIGDHCTLAGQVGVTGHIEIGDNVMVAAQGGVAHSLAPNAVYMGTPAVPAEQGRRCAVLYTKLPEIVQELRELRRKVVGKGGAAGGPSPPRKD